MEILFKIIITNSIILNCLFWSMEKSDEDKNLHIILSPHRLQDLYAF